jgi:DNA-directed RNA polymerase specialized sigma24 family protein
VDPRTAARAYGVADARPGGTPADPADRVTLEDLVSMAFLVLLESVSPAERVAFILHDVFRYPFAPPPGPRDPGSPAGASSAP